MKKPPMSSKVSDFSTASLSLLIESSVAKRFVVHFASPELSAIRRNWPLFIVSGRDRFQEFLALAPEGGVKVGLCNL